ncbi:transcriptional repressor scratch 2-like [Liolophura sinensis]|uniref:transcriptional repressor scratch 2-like n=1 Tax=Liolophura sinensis TaxID=3198878 RepID=UPI003158C8C8
MPRSFLVKKVKCGEDRTSFKLREIYAESAVSSLKALTPYTPSFPPLSVTINTNAFIHDVLPTPTSLRDRGEDSDGGHTSDSCCDSMPKSPEGSFSSSVESIDDLAKPDFHSGITIDYTYEAFFISDGRSRKKPVVPSDVVVPEKVGSRQRYSCNECGKHYATSSNLSRHKQTHRSLDSQLAKKCPHCHKVYVSMPALSMHILTHDLKHKCEICGKAFSRPWLLQGHQRSHTGEKPFGCAHCGKAFADRSNLRAHMQTHSAFKHYKCKRCDKSFALKSYLNKHYESACIKE